MLFATPSKDAATVTRFVADFQAHHGDPAAVTTSPLDMSPAFIKGVTTPFPAATIPFAKCHGMKLLGDAVEAVLREERKVRPALAGTPSLGLKNPRDRKP